MGVVGAGAVANAALLMATRLGLKVLHMAAPIAAQPQPPAVPRAFAIAPRVQTQLEQLGVWGLLPSTHVQLATRMQVFFESSTARTVLPLDAAEAGVPQLCSFVAEHHLAAALTTAVQVTTSQRQHIQASVVAVQETGQGQHLTLSNGDTALCDVVIAADGAQSPLRQLLGLDPTVYDYGHSAVVAVVAAHASHKGTAWQWLGTDGSVLALLPLPSSLGDSAAQYGLVWSQPREQALAYMQAPQTMMAVLNDRCAGQTGALTLASAQQSFPLMRANATQLTRGGVVLVGDAAHRIHPLAGQGLNLGFEDVFALGDILAAREWRHCADPRLMARYQRARAAPLAVMGGVVHGLARRGAWPASVQALTRLGLAGLGQPTCCGAWFRRKMIQQMI